MTFRPGLTGQRFAARLTDIDSINSLSRERLIIDLQLKGKKAIVTGGTAGIGLAIARVLTEEGVDVTISGRNSKKLSEAVSCLPGRARGIEADLGTAEESA